MLDRSRQVRHRTLSSRYTENKFQNQLAAVRNRFQELKEAKKVDSPDAGGIGTNTFIYDQLMAINEDLTSLYQSLNQTLEFAKRNPGGHSGCAASTSLRTLNGPISEFKRSKRPSRFGGTMYSAFAKQSRA